MKEINLEKAKELPEEIYRLILSVSRCENMTTLNRFYEIENLHQRMSVPVKTLCIIFGVSRSGYYKFLSHRDDKINKNMHLRQEILEIQKAYDDAAGYRTITKHINRRRIKAGEKTVSAGRVYRVMKYYGLFSKAYDSKRNRVIADGIFECENVMQHNYNDREVNECWCTDITEIRLLCGYKLYLCAIIDLGSRRIMAYQISRRQRASLVFRTLMKALTLNSKAVPCIMHSDNGRQFYSKEYLDIICRYKIRQSTSEPGTPGDNAVIEAFFSCLKRECLYRSKLTEEKMVRRLIVRYINFYNSYRILHRLNMTPDERYAKY